MKRFASRPLGPVMLGALVALTGCAGAAPQSPLEAVEAAIRDAPAGLDEVRADEGIDGFSRHVLLVLVASGDELPVDGVTETLDTVGDVLPEEYDSVHVVARSASGDRLDVDTALESLGFSETYMVSPTRAHITASAVRAFASEG